MVSRREQSSTLEDIGGSSDTNALTEMRAAMDKLCHQNQILENNVLKIQQRQQEATPIKNVEVMEP